MKHFNRCAERISPCGLRINPFFWAKSIIPRPLAAGWLICAQKLCKNKTLMLIAFRALCVLTIDNFRLLRVHLQLEFTSIHQDIGDIHWNIG